MVPRIFGRWRTEPGNRIIEAILRNYNEHEKNNHTLSLYRKFLSEPDGRRLGKGLEK